MRFFQQFPMETCGQELLKNMSQTNEPDKHEMAVIYNELVANAIMRQTVEDQTRILQVLHNKGYLVDSADLACLSP